MLRKILAVLAGIIAATFIFMGFETLNGKLYPMPPGLDPANYQAMSDYVRSLPALALVIVLAGWATGSFVCGLLVRLISVSREKTPAYIAGLFLMTAGIVDIFMLPHPVWFTIIGIVLFIPFTLIGHSVRLRA